MSDEYHALASPSSSAKWLNCANSLAMEIGQPDGDSKAADLGTDKHELLALCLEFARNAMDYEGHIPKKGHTVNKELATDVQTVLDSVRERIRAYELRGATVAVDVEQDVPVDHITGEDNATGRVDIVLRVIWPDGATDADVIDAKFGYTEVLAEGNTQGLMYMSGVIEKFSLVDEFRNISFVIEQPLRTNSEWQVTPAIVNEWVEWASPRAAKAILIHKMAGERALKEEDFSPAEKTCQWCKAKAVCPALRNVVEEAIEESFDTFSAPHVSAQIIPVEKLGEKFEQLELLEDWIKAVRARIEYEVFAGNTVPGVKVVAGKRGNRAWSSDEEAEALMKKFKMKQDEMYSFKLLGPKPILDALKDQPRRLKQIEQLVVQAEGKPHVVHESDKRPAIEIKPVEDGFDTVDELC
jgi:hypothetical protein